MLRLASVFALFTVLACSSAPRSQATPPAVATATPPRIIGYLASWGVRSKGTRIAELPGRELTHIIYAFARITEDGRLALSDPCLDAGACDSSATPAARALAGDGGNFGELRRLKARYPPP